MSGIIRHVKAASLFFLILFCLNFAACVKSSGQDIVVYDCFSVNFLDVGEGDAVFINFGDGKTMLIDCGEKSDKNFKTVSRFLDAYAENGLNYFVLTHPDNDHVGNADAILDKYAVKTAYIPYLLQPENFGAYYPAYCKITDKNIGRFSVTGNTIFGEDYYAVFLSPDKWDNPSGSAYEKVNSTSTPSAEDINDLSPVIYLEYKDVSFVFTGDAGVSQEKVALNNVQTGIINGYLKHDIDLTDTDFLKVSHHGADDGSGEEFLMALTPKNAVISVGGDNRYGHASGQTISRIKAASPECKIYTTSEHGSISVLVDDSGNIAVKTDA